MFSHQNKTRQLNSSRFVVLLKSFLVLGLLMSCVSLPIIAEAKTPPESSLANDELIQRPAIMRLAPSSNNETVHQAIEEFHNTRDESWIIRRHGISGVAAMISGGRTVSLGTSPEEAALSFVQSHRLLLGLRSQDHSVVVIRSESVKIGHRVVLQQRVKGLSVFGGKIIIITDSSGRVLHVANSAWPVLALEDSEKGDVALAQRSVEARFSSQKIVVTEDPELVLYPTGDGRFAMVSFIEVGDPSVFWRVVTDARTGDILEEISLKSNAGKSETIAVKTGSSESASISKMVHLMGEKDVTNPGDREWAIASPPGEVEVVPVPDPEDPYFVSVDVGISSFGADELDPQAHALYAAGIKLYPGIEYTIRITYDLFTWDAYGSTAPFGGGFFDVFFANVNSTAFYWDLDTRPFIDLACEEMVDGAGVVLPGVSHTFGGEIWADGFLCETAGILDFSYMEVDMEKDVYLTVGLDTGDPSLMHDSFPSWGNYSVEIIAETKVFDPNPVTTLNDMFVDSNNAHNVVPGEAYFDIPLPNLDEPAPGAPFKLTGDYVRITNLEAPLYSPPTARGPHFPYLRSSDHFEAVNCYYHLTVNQLYLQMLGYDSINNRRIDVDPHGLNGADNSHYVGNATGTGYLAFGDGGVDDAEDADIILHECGHAIQDNQTIGAYFGNGTNGFGNESRAMGEGFGDFWAFSNTWFASTASGFDVAAMGEWDALSMGGLRRLDRVKTYPVGMTNSLHADGEIWSRSLYDIFLSLGKNATDILVLNHHWLVGSNPRFSDAAEALLAADILENDGNNETAIVSAFVNRGIFRQLVVESAPVGASIVVDNLDVAGAGNGNASFTRNYAWGDTVHLTAPTIHDGNPFDHWVVDGVTQPDGQTTVQVVTDHTPAQHIAKAVYLLSSPVVAGFFNAVHEGNAVEIVWEIQDDPYFSGVRLYRAEGDGELVLLNSEGLLSLDESPYYDLTAEPGIEYRYVQMVVLEDGSEVYFQESKAAIPAPKLALHSNYPNPFNPSTRLAFVLPRAMSVSLNVYDVQGRLIRQLRNGIMQPGLNLVQWDGENDRGESANSGVYLYRLVTGDGSLSRKMTLLK